jgi:hypothetical protein
MVEAPTDEEARAVCDRLVEEVRRAAGTTTLDPST